jgi:hypothetical protein
MAELHTITVFEADAKPWLPIILTGRSNLIDKLMYQTSAPLASRTDLCGGRRVTGIPTATTNGWRRN